MNKTILRSFIGLILLLGFNKSAFSNDTGFIAGSLDLDNSWERIVYLSYLDAFDKAYAISSELIVGSAVVDSVGTFKLSLSTLPTEWSLLRLHIVKKGVSPYSLVIGGNDENHYFLIARRDSKIKLVNAGGEPVFENVNIEGAPYMDTFEYIQKLSDYPNALDFENSYIEKEFIIAVVSEKLKVVADTCANPLVSLYALYQTDFYSDYLQHPNFYHRYNAKWINENSSYFESFRSKFPGAQPFPWSYTAALTIVLIGVLISAVFFWSEKKGKKINALSVQERRIFDLVQQGLSNKEISSACNIELSTVKSHVSNIYSKLNIKSRKEALNVKVK